MKINLCSSDVITIEKNGRCVLSLLTKNDNLNVDIIDPTSVIVTKNALRYTIETESKIDDLICAISDAVNCEGMILPDDFYDYLEIRFGNLKSFEKLAR